MINKFGWAMAAPLMFGNFTPGFVDHLAGRLQGQRVLEIFSGNGYLASELRRRGVDIRPTTIFSGHDGHQYGMHCDVEEIDAIEAVKAHGTDSDVLLMAWPTTTVAAVKAVLEWGATKPIFYIGEVTDYAKRRLGGCATDHFFEAISVVDKIGGYEPKNALEQAIVVQLRPDYVLQPPSMDLLQWPE